MVEVLNFPIAVINQRMHGLFRIPGVIVLSRLCANIYLSDLFDDQFIEGRGVGFQFQSSDPDEAGLVSDPNSNDLTDGSFVQAKL